MLPRKRTLHETSTVAFPNPENDDYFLVMRPRKDLKHVKPMYTESLSLTKMRANQEFDLGKITK